MSKLEKNSEDEVEKILDETKPVKEKKPRSQKQIDACNKMREALVSRKNDKLKIKEETRLEHQAMQIEIAKKLEKLKKREKIEKKVEKKANDKVEKKLQQKLKELVSDSDSEELSSVSSEEIVIKKKHSKKTEPVVDNKIKDGIKVNFY